MRFGREILAICFVLLLAVPGASAQSRQEVRGVIVGQGQIRFDPPPEGGRLRVAVTSVYGEKIFDSGEASAEPVYWNRIDAQGQPVAAGIYLAEVSLIDAAGRERRRTEKLTISGAAGMTNNTGSSELWNKLAKFIPPPSGTNASYYLVASSIVDIGGKVGIGTDAPQATMEIVGPDNRQVPAGSPAPPPLSPVLMVKGGKGGDMTNGGDPIVGLGASVSIYAGDGGIGGGRGGNITLQPGLAGGAIGHGHPGVDGAVILAPSGGYVGIGTTGPVSGSKLTVSGGVALADGALKFPDGTSISSAINGTGIISLPPLTGKGTELDPLKLVDNSILSQHLADGTVTTVKIASNAVTAEKLGVASVTTEKITSNAVTAEKLGVASVTAVKLHNSAVTTEKISDHAVTTRKLAPFSVTTATIADRAVTLDKLAVPIAFVGSDETNAILQVSNNFTGKAGPAAAIKATGTIETTAGFAINGQNALRFGPGSGVFIGVNAGSSVTELGAGNSFVGAGAGRSNTSGKENSFFGNVSGQAGTIGSYNSFFGSNAGSTNTTGQGNVFAGYRAGYSNTSGGENVFIGSQSGSLNETGQKNVFIGAHTRGAARNVVNAAAIGYRAEVRSSNSIVLGGVVGFNGATSNVNVGIGTVEPKTSLHLKSGDLYLETSGRGVILASPNGSCFRLSVNDLGAISTEAVKCP